MPFAYFLEDVKADEMLQQHFVGLKACFVKKARNKKLPAASGQQLCQMLRQLRAEVFNLGGLLLVR